MGWKTPFPGVVRCHVPKSKLILARRVALRGDRGAVLPLVAIVLPVLILLTAFAVDLGRQRASRRTMQARADVIALDLARLMDGRIKNKEDKNFF